MADIDPERTSVRSLQVVLQKTRSRHLSTTQHEVVYFTSWDISVLG
ncbi:hypothetical protein SAMN05878249_0587 [Vreelandella aquamarina]|jgi:hypothetical protein|uniref:Uncharacterized protein n=1 Tax=Vreelandella aquamarina TaxID=77097 RepID=A0A1N6D746_9GAMM|nr:hypothetical protein SAMN05878249_0587 [Halomonas meridiana]SIN66599.1 hypothetical protein SAMN05878438_2016 [Halomonas meridiana]SIN98126.1 hypothetical protein SAMN05878442_0372 [Halomonas meridiana]